MPEITEDELMGILGTADLDSYDDDCADMAIALIESKAPSWTTTGNLRTDSPLYQLLQVVRTPPPDMADGFASGRSDVLEYLTAKRTLWELGVSLALLGLSNVRLEELQRLTNDQFWKSHYVIYFTALLRSKGLAVEFVKEENFPTPDIKANGWYIECKERNCGTPSQAYFGSMFRKSKDKFNKKDYQPGIVAYDIVPDNLFAPAGVKLEAHYKQIAEAAFMELVKLKGVQAAIITIRRILSRNEDRVGYPTVWMCLLKNCGDSSEFNNTWSQVFQFIWTEDNFEGMRQ